MRKIIASEFYTLDGLMSDPLDEMDWVLSIFNAEVGKYENSLYDNADTLLLGRTTYKIFEGYWPDAATRPSTPERDIELARKINDITKIVFSRTLQKVEWQNSRLLHKIVPQEILDMKQQPGRDMLIIGSASIVQQFANLGLIDEYHLLVHPVVLGHGKPLFARIHNRLQLKLLQTKTFSSGVVLLCYQPMGKAP